MLPLGGIQSLRFCPYEDVLGVGCAGGISSVLIPGAGEPNFDSFVANPFQGKKERQEQEVVQLLDKLQPETIMLDPAAVGKVRRECRCCRGLREGVLRTGV
jgi:U3 small nucleolar RNA-associated protein 7